MNARLESSHRRPTQGRRPFWAVGSIALSVLGYARALATSTCIEKDLVCAIRGAIAYGDLAICVLLAFAIACVAAFRHERRAIVWLSFVVSSPFLLYVLYVVISQA